ncbi:MAG: hypothetical protein RLY93_08805 [Sumerlaeia bacterium]
MESNEINTSGNGTPDVLEIGEAMRLLKWKVVLEVPLNSNDDYLLFVNLCSRFGDIVVVFESQEILIVQIAGKLSGDVRELCVQFIGFAGELHEIWGVKLIQGRSRNESKYR